MIFWVAKFSFALLISKQINTNSHPIAQALIHWYSGAKRDLPWRRTKDPYTVWVSEIILQQTRVDQGLPYFERFIDAFPDIRQLASAPENDVLAIWQGLGYYSRARNMHAAAKFVVDELGGNFPENYADILKLKGVGPYTAAAIASICFDEPEPVVDGNVFRVASRLFGIESDISLGKSRADFVNTLKEVIDHGNPGDFNQAIMEYGATVCKPAPNCEICVFQKECYARANDKINALPVKSKKLKVKERAITYLVVTNADQLLMKKRDGKDIWKGLYDFPETSDNSLELSEPIIHSLSHQRLSVRFHQQEVSEKEFSKLATSLQAEAFSLKQVLNLPKPKVIADYIRKQS